ncbi:MAG: zinc ribbon domain-containing protein [Holophaga sp.]|nr:zinc ribbon domain-containing protein [Holophaga sp.]
MSTCHACAAETAPGSAFCSACGAPLAAGPSKGLASGIFTYVPHPHIEYRRKRPPKKAHQQDQPPSAPARFNTWLGVKITNSVGTMWCAYVFAALALISLPEAFRAGTAPLIAWIAQTFLQLVLLSIIMVGQKVEGTASENRAIDTYQDAEALLSEVMQIQKHLLAQDAWLHQLILAHGGQEPPARPARGPQAP